MNTQNHRESGGRVLVFRGDFAWLAFGVDCGHISQGTNINEAILAYQDNFSGTQSLMDDPIFDSGTRVPIGGWISGWERTPTGYERRLLSEDYCYLDAFNRGIVCEPRCGLEELRFYEDGYERH